MGRFSLITLILLSALYLEAKGNVPPGERVDCAPRPGDSNNDCVSRGCIWDPDFDKNNPTVPLCYFPPSTGYTLYGQTGPSTLKLHKYSQGAKNPYSDDLPEIELSYHNYGSVLHVNIGEKSRFVPPVPLNNIAQNSPQEPLTFNISQSSQTFAFSVRRVNDDTALWDTSIGGLLFGDQFIQIATFLPTDRLYGFGENVHQSLKHEFRNYRSWGMWSRDEAPNSVDPNSNNYYGVHPFYLAVEPSGKAHGVFIFNSNAQEVVTGPSPHLIYRTIGGQLDIYFFPGPKPEDVVQQYQELVGRPYLPAYWALGFQFCRYGYTGLDDLKSTVDRIQKAQIPLDVAYADIDYMNHYQDFTIGQEKWADFPAYAEKLHSMDVKLVLIHDPAIDVTSEAFKRAREQGVSFIKWERMDQVPQDVQSLYPLANGTKIMLSVVWPDNHVAYPDFLDPSNRTLQWWTSEIERFHKLIPFDGLWIDMNEPSAFGTNEGDSMPNTKDKKPLRCPSNGQDSRWDAPPYQTINAYQYPMKTINEKTVCMLGRTMGGEERVYNTHSLYGWSEMVATLSALYKVRGRRTEVISRSTFSSSGRYGGHWLGDNTSRWPDLRSSIIGILEFNLFGITHVGADVCGFIAGCSEELCLRWQQLGAFYPFYRNHNENTAPPQDPPQWKSVAVATREANLFRYRFLPYLYTLMFRASLNGGTVIRPLFFEFPADPTTYDGPVADRQFLWGANVLVVPVLEPNVTTVRGYLPRGANWYSLSTANGYAAGRPNGWQQFDAPRDTPLPVFVRGGSILPAQHPAMTTTQSRQNPWALVVALSPRPSASVKTLQAEGELFWDDGESLIVPEGDFSSYTYLHFQFQASMDTNGARVQIQRSRNGASEQNCNAGSKCFEDMLLDTIDVFGLPWTPDAGSFALNGRPVAVKRADYDKKRKYLQILTEIQIGSSEEESLVLTWTHAGASKPPSDKEIDVVRVNLVDSNDESYDVLLVV